MSNHLSKTFAAPIYLGYNANPNPGLVAQALNAAFSAHPIDGINIEVHTQYSAAQAALLSRGAERVSDKPTHFPIDSDRKAIWITISGPHDDTSKLIGDYITADDLSVLNGITLSADHADALKAHQLSISSVLRDLLTLKIQEATYEELPTSSETEYIDLAQRGSYIKTQKSIDPLDTFFNAEEKFALQDSLAESNDFFISDNEAQTINHAIDAAFTSDSEETVKLLEKLQALGIEEHDLKELLQEQCRDILSNMGGAVSLLPEGRVSVTATPLVNGENAYISFDGISSSSFNAVVDEGYLAMLDTLNVSPKVWFEHLTSRLPEVKSVNWDIDLSAIVKAHRSLARYSPDTGWHYESPECQESILHSIQQQLLELDYEQYGEDALASSKESIDAIFPIALEVLKEQACDLDIQWMHQNGIDTEKLASIQVASQQFAAFPQLVNSPDHYMAIVNLGAGNSISYEWKNNPVTNDNANALITCKALESMLDNASYSGRFAIGFDLDIEDSKKINDAANSDLASTITIRGACAHIHDFINGAGDYEHIEPITISLQDLKNPEMWRLDNDADNSYGVEGVYGEFSGRDCTIQLNIPTPEKVVEQSTENTI